MKRTAILIGISLALFFALSPVSHGSVQECTPPPTGLIGWWPGDANAFDIANANDGTLTNGATFAGGRVGQAFSFDGVDDFVEIPNNPTLNPATSITVDAWIFVKSTGFFPAIVSKGNVGNYAESYDLFLWTDNSLAFLVNTDGTPSRRAMVVGGSPIPLNTWTHVAGSYDGTTVRAFVNGTEVASLAWSGGINPTPNPVLIGKADRTPSPYPDSFLNGLIDEVEIFNRALPQSEIQAIFNAGIAGKCRTCTVRPDNLVSWWPGDENAFDIKGNNDGTITGAIFEVGKVRQAFKLAGDDYVEVADNSALNPSQLTVDAWIKTTFLPSPYSAHFIVAKSGSNGYHGYELGTTVDGKVRFTVLAGAVPYGDAFGTSIVADGEWHHIAGTYDGAYLKIYVDGNLDATSSYSGGISYLESSPLYIGKRQYAGIPGFFNGLIDEVEIFNRALSAEEIRAIVNAGNAGKCLEGCSHGFWKNHPDVWGPTGYTMTQTIEDVFDVPNAFGLDSDFLLTALSYPGGKDLVGAARILLRQAVAALLNAAYPDVTYPNTVEQVIADVNAALASGDRQTMLTLASALDADNNLLCPLE